MMKPNTARKMKMAAIDDELLALDNVISVAPKTARSKEARRRVDSLAWKIEDMRSDYLGEPQHPLQPKHITTR